MKKYCQLNSFSAGILVMCCLQLLVAQHVNSQLRFHSKPPIDLRAIDQWTYAERPAISADGKYALCFISNSPTGYQTLAISSTEGAWKREIIAKDFKYGDAHFTSDSRFCVFGSTGDSLGIVRLGTSEVTYVAHVNSMFDVLKGDLPYVVYETTDIVKQTVVYHPGTGKAIYAAACQSHVLDPSGRYLLCQFNNSGPARSQLAWIDLATGSQTAIWSGSEAKDFKFDVSGSRLAFIAKSDSGAEACIMLYQRGDQVAGMIATDNNIPVQGHYGFSSLTGFTHDGTMLFLNIKNLTADQRPSPKKAKVDIWNFNDPMVQEEELGRHITPSKEVFSVLNLNSKKIVPLCKPQGFFHWDPADINFPDRLFLYTDNAGGEINEAYWNKSALDTVSLISAMDGSKKVIDFDLTFAKAEGYHLSPDGKYVLYFDDKSKNYFSYNVETGARINLTKDVQEEWYYACYKVQKIQSLYTRGIAGWIRNGNDVLIEGKYDLWRVCLDGSRPPVCVTKHYGQAHQIEFRFPKSTQGYSAEMFDESKPVYLSAFSPMTKRNGFFSADLTGRAEPILLTMSNYAYFVPQTDHEWGAIEPIKAANANIWLVGRGRSEESINYCITKDFKSFAPLTNIYPERGYNWLTTELVTWKLPDGHVSQGVLYKPENFDPKKKYPLIFLFYEELSNNLNVYHLPERSGANINIPYYVSNGYLVFTPDIERTSAGTGEDALNTMVSAARWLSKFPYVDSKRLGLCGGSMGGYKTNFIVTHSHLFAAANPNVGPSSIASFGLSEWGDVMAGSEVEIAQFYIGHSIGERPDLYVTNSPIFYVDQIQTPMLMMYNKKDEYNYVDGVALFQAMRREGKPVWMCQYDGAGHGIFSEDTIATTDWTIRQKQFFDHYLKGAPSPVWMTRGIPAWRKGIDDGLEMDPEVTTPTEKLMLTHPGNSQTSNWTLTESLTPAKK